MDIQELRNYLPALNDTALLQAIADSGKVYTLHAGEALIAPGQYIKQVPLILEGTVKVMRTDPEGHELFLYYLEPAQTCAVSLSCCSTLQKSEIKAVAEEKVKLIAIPFQLHEAWSNQFKQWKEFVAKTYQSRFQELLHTIDAVAFKKMDERLLSYLSTKTRQLKTNELSVTHQDIANELGTSREVVSRLLKQLEKSKLVELGRNKLYIRDDIEEWTKK